jgi:hypothetical protein
MHSGNTSSRSQLSTHADKVKNQLIQGLGIPSPGSESATSTWSNLRASTDGSSDDGDWTDKFAPIYGSSPYITCDVCCFANKQDFRRIHPGLVTQFLIELRSAWIEDGKCRVIQCSYIYKNARCIHASFPLYYADDILALANSIFLPSLLTSRLEHQHGQHTLSDSTYRHNAAYRPACCPPIIFPCSVQHLTRRAGRLSYRSCLPSWSLLQQHLHAQLRPSSTLNLISLSLYLLINL